MDEPQQQTPQTPQTTDPQNVQIPSAHEGGMGAMIGIAIILGLMIVGGVYVYGTQLKQDALEEELPFILGDEPSSQASPTASDDISSLEADMSADMDALEAEIEADLDALEQSL